jgi:carbon starvation protein
MKVLAWGYFIYTGQINTIWPMFGVANQLLATVALAVCTSILINLGRSKYIWVTVAPLIFLGTNTLYGGYLNITGNYYPLAVGANAARHTEGWILTICTTIMMVLAIIVLTGAVQKWMSVLSGGRAPATAGTA